MMLPVTAVRFVAVDGELAQVGVLGRADVEVANALVVRGVWVRRARRGHLVVSFPRAVRGACRSRVRLAVHPTSREAHADFQRQVLAILAQQWGARP